MSSSSQTTAGGAASKNAGGTSSYRRRSDLMAVEPEKSTMSARVSNLVDKEYHDEEVEGFDPRSMSAADVENALSAAEADPKMQRIILLDERIPYDYRRDGMMEYLKGKNLTPGLHGTSIMQTFVQSAGTVQFSDFAVNRMEEIEHPGRAAAAKKKAEKERKAKRAAKRKTGAPKLSTRGEERAKKKEPVGENGADVFSRLYRNDEMEYTPDIHRRVKLEGERVRKVVMVEAREAAAKKGLPPAEVSKIATIAADKAKEEAEENMRELIQKEARDKRMAQARWRMLRLVVMPACRWIVTQRIKYQRLHQKLIKEAIMNGVQFYHDSDGDEYTDSDADDSDEEGEEEEEEEEEEGGGDSGSGSKKPSKGRRKQSQGDVSQYTIQNLIERSNLRRHRLIRGVIMEMWEIEDMEKDLHSGQLTREAYVKFIATLNKVLVPDIQWEEAMGQAENDWAQDTSEGQDTMSFDQFHSSMFELADMWCETIDAEEYTHFLRNLLSNMADKLEVDDEDGDADRVLTDSTGHREAAPGWEMVEDGHNKHGKQNKSASALEEEVRLNRGEMLVKSRQNSARGGGGSSSRSAASKRGGGGGDVVSQVLSAGGKTGQRVAQEANNGGSGDVVSQVLSAGGKTGQRVKQRRRSSIVLKAFDDVTSPLTADLTKKTAPVSPAKGGMVAAAPRTNQNGTKKGHLQDEHDIVEAVAQGRRRNSNARTLIRESSKRFQFSKGEGGFKGSPASSRMPRKHSMQALDPAEVAKMSSMTPTTTTKPSPSRPSGSKPSMASESPRAMRNKNNNLLAALS